MLLQGPTDFPAKGGAWREHYCEIACPVIVKSGLLDPLYLKEDVRQEKSHRSSFLESNL